MNIDELRARQSEIRSRLQEIHAEHANGGVEALPEAARNEWNELNTELDENDAKIAEFEAREARLREIAGNPSAREGGSATFNTRRAGVVTGDDIYDLSTVRASVSHPEQAAEEMRDRAMRAIEAAQFPHEDANREDVQAHIERLVNKHTPKDGGALAQRILATGSPTYQRAFGKALIGKPLNDAETRALSLTDSAGGYAVPFTLDPTVIPTSNGAVNPLRAISRVETITTDEWKGVTSAGITAAYAAEGTEASDNAPTLGQPSATPERAQAFIPYSIEIGQDWSSLQSEMAALLQDAKDELEAEKFANGAGSGSNEPEGVLVGVTATVAAGSAAFAVAHLYALQAALPPRFRPNASFVAENAQYNRVRQFDTSGGADLWVQLGDGRPDRLLGKPAYELSTMDSTLTNGSEIMLYGDFRHFLIVDRIGMTVELIPHLFGASGRPTGSRGLYAIWRNTSDVLVPGAFRKLVTSA